MAKTIVKVKKELVILDHIKQAEAKLPDIAKYQIASSGSPVFVVKTEKDVELIQNSIKKLQHILEAPATANEVSVIIDPIFKILASQNKQQVDLKIEVTEWVKLLEGEPLWAIKNGVEKVCRTEKFRHFCDLDSAIKKQTKPIVAKIEKLTLIAEESLKKIEEEKYIKENSISAEQFQNNMNDFAKSGSQIAQSYLKNIKIPTK